MKTLQKKFFEEVGDVRQLLGPLERIPGAMFMIKDLDSRYIYMSQALRRAVHLPENLDVVGKTDFDLFPKIIAQSFRQNDLQVFKQGRPLLNEVHAVGFFAHAMKWAYSSKYPLRDRSGKVAGLITINEEYNDVMGQDDELNRLLPAIEYISKHFAETITVVQLARRCSFSESHFTRIFKQRMNMTPYAFVEQVRMFHALDTLQHSARSIAQIALDCGFYDPSSFVKRFKKFTGTTPLRYRREQQARVQSARAIALPEAHPKDGGMRD
ncbi:helix-turn-helix domain-containing protein [Prosthecobacter sp.]|uniref:AraC family transcriptional regulator n=1 Tax=Prosthecobacter sp. TaxID=1965333 RepID=UPI0037852427